MLSKIVIGVLVLGVAIQFVPYGREHSNPPVTLEPDWDSANTRELFFRACRDCHSNETVWPWYSYVAPVSWLVSSDVNEGREHLNVSDWGRPDQHGDEAAEMVREGDMPLWFYLPLHARARLSPAERKRFIAGLERTFGSDHGH
ncbi:MAG: heme-binding domain-containing protein [Myxococcota bacterium]|nr:heme-binding domain-containing protein [Myxococcota bacterium]